MIDDDWIRARVESTVATKYGDWLGTNDELKVVIEASENVFIEPVRSISNRITLQKSSDWSVATIDPNPSLGH